MIYDTGYNGTPTDLPYDNFSFTEKFLIQGTQEITLKHPAYKNYRTVNGNDLSLKVVDLDNDAVLLEDTGWSIPEDGLDSGQVIAEVCANANVTLAEYTPTIVRKLVITVASPTHVQITYQRPTLERDEPVVVTGSDGIGPRYSPALMQRVIDRVSKLERTSGNNVSLFGTEIDNADILDEDPTGLAPENYVRYERHEVNTNASINLLQPSRGPFYKQGLAIHASVERPVTLSEAFVDDYIEDGHRYLFSYSDASMVSSNLSHLSTMRRVLFTSKAAALALLPSPSEGVYGSLTGTIVDLSATDTVELTAGVDYVLTDVDIARTSVSSNQSGVFKAIKFVTARVGVVFVSYHAFGGVATAADVRMLKQEMVNTRSVVLGGDLLTGTELKKHEYIMGLNKRLSKIESYHNFNSQVEHNIGTTVPGFHWINIAYIYPGEDNIEMLNDIGQFRVYSTLRKWNYEFIVDLDMSRTNENEFLQIKTVGTNQRASKDVGDISKLINRDIVAARLCWVDQGGDRGKASGLVLQIGWDFDAYQGAGYDVDNDTIVVTNRSGHTSNWMLCLDPDQVGFAASGLITVYYHNHYAITSDTTAVAGKKYFEYVNRYTYFITYDSVFKEGKTYYSCSSIDGTYSAMTVTPGEAIVGEVYERKLIGRYIKQATVSTGASVVGKLELDAQETYNHDEHFTMPNTSLDWYPGGGSAHSSDKAIVKLLEPDDGVIVWAGNEIMDNLVAKPASACADCNEVSTTPSEGARGQTLTLPVCLNSYLQNALDVRAIRAVTMVFFDRVKARYTTVHTQLGTTFTLPDADEHYKDSDRVVGEVPFCYDDNCFADVAIVASNANSSNRLDIVYTKSGNEYVKTTQNHGSKNLIEIELSDVFMGSFSVENHRFDLRQIRVHM